MKKKMKKKKIGFTLIELLAVIIVLAIIALIATPIIFNVIENAKLKSLENSCYGVIDAVRTKYAEGLLNSEDGTIDLDGNVTDLSVSGEHPIAGTWKIDNSKNSVDRGIRIEGVKFASMKDYTCTNVDENGEITGKVNCEKDGPDEVQPTITPKNEFVTVNKGINKKIEEYFDIKFGKTGGTVTCEVENVSTLEEGNHTIKCIATGTNGKTAEANIKIIVELVKYIDNSGANRPELFGNMIPIKYESNKWVVADLYQKWYDYDTKQWANAVVLNSGVTKNVGDEVTEEEIYLWYVWIPRYKYTLFDNVEDKEKEINIIFENNIEVKSNGTTRGQNLTHPAFTFGNTELTGFWVGKFELGGSANSSNVITEIMIKPNVTSLASPKISQFFTAIKDINIENADSHMMKNIEWGAVAYLKQSKYGLGTTDIGTNNNTGYITGCGAPAGSSSSSSCDAYNTENGMLASTTGNIYGIYDMSGGAGEYVMGNYNDILGGSAFGKMPDSKYYDKYTGNVGINGDATSETSGWYSDSSTFPSSSGSWFARGGGRYNVKYAGIFQFEYGSGSSYSGASTRAVLSAQ